MKLLPVILAILAGIFTTVEAGINAQLGKYITPAAATLHSLLLGAILMLLVCLYTGKLGEYYRLVYVRPIWLIGGIFGALIIFFSSKAIPEIGISDTIILILTGQLLSALVIDVLYNETVIGARKAVGLVLFLIGTVIFLRD